MRNGVIVAARGQNWNCLTSKLETVRSYEGSLTVNQLARFNVAERLNLQVGGFPYTALVDFQLDAQNSYLFIYNASVKIFYMFRALPCSSSGGLRRNCIYAASGIVTLCR
jgi:hypothetical protein